MMEKKKSPAGIKRVFKEIFISRFGNNAPDPKVLLAKHNEQRECAERESALPQSKYEDIAKAFQFGLALGFGKKCDEMNKVKEKNMDREKYVNDQNYRDGFNEGLEVGREQMKKKIEYASNEIKKILSIFEDKESEDKKW